MDKRTWSAEEQRRRFFRSKELRSHAMLSRVFLALAVVYLGFSILAFIVAPNTWSWAMMFSSVCMFLIQSVITLVVCHNVRTEINTCGLEEEDVH